VPTRTESFFGKARLAVRDRPSYLLKLAIRDQQPEKSVPIRSRRSTSGLRELFGDGHRGGFSWGILTNTAYLGAARIAQLIVSFTVGVSVARHLGPANAGALAYAVSFVALFASAAALGLDTIVIRDLAAKDPVSAAAGEVLSSAFVLRMFASPATLMTIIAASMLINRDDRTRLLVVIVASGVMFQPLSVVDLYFQSLVQSKYVVYMQLAALAVVSTARVVLVQMNSPLVAFAVVTGVETALSMCGLAYAYSRHRGGLPKLSASKQVAWRLLIEAWPLALTGILTSIYINVDRVLIKHLLGDASAGKYAVVVSISTALYFVPIAFGQSLFPSLIKARHDVALYRQRLQQAFDTLLWAAIVIALPVTLLAEPLMRLLYGAPYAGSGAALAILIWSAVATLLGLVTSYWLVAENLQRMYPVRILASLCTCVALNLVLVPRWGIRGAAVATVIAQFVSSTILYAFRQKTRILVVMQIKALVLPYRLWASWTKERNNKIL
jgi:O-antigen/teichoic acid export membrane protein